MHCVEVIQGLASAEAFGDGPDSASTALAEHLAVCPRCAAWARRDARLGRLWEATRPEEPAPSAWATVWARVSQAADAPTATATAGSRPWRRWAWGAVAVAQAAVLLVATWLVFATRPDPGRPQDKNAIALKPSVHEPKSDPAPTQALAVLAVASIPVELDENSGSIVLIRSQGAKVEVINEALDEGFGDVDRNFVMLGILEAMAE
jgi:hypothetical protein